MKSRFLLIGLTVIAVLGACTSTNIDATSQLDPYGKVVVIPPATGKLTADVTEIFKQNSWKTGSTKDDVPTARYSLALSYNQTELCMPRFDPMYDYDLTLTDNAHGTRVFNMHGRDCQHTILGHLDDYLHGKKL